MRQVEMVEELLVTGQSLGYGVPGFEFARKRDVHERF